MRTTGDLGRPVEDLPDGDPQPYGIPPDGYRLPSEAHVGRIRLQVRDLGRSVAWYTQVLGFDVLAPLAERPDAPAGATGRPSVALGPHGSAPLVELFERPDARPLAPWTRLGLFHFAILLPDRAALGRLIADLVRGGLPFGSSDHRVSEAIYLQDPDGLGVEVYADRPRSGWAHRGRQLVMTTEPLDLADLVRAGSVSEGNRLPPGTVIGHVHLHVGDLPAADRFYHEGLGFDRMVWDYPGALFLGAGGYHHHLGLNVWAAGAVPAREDDARLLEWELVVPASEDVVAVQRSVVAAGTDGAVGVSIEPGAGPSGGASGDGAGALVADPWGTSVRVRAAGS